MVEDQVGVLPALTALVCELPLLSPAQLRVEGSVAKAH